MQRILAIIRNNKYHETKEKLMESGFSAFSQITVLGKGNEKKDFLARKLIMIWAFDEDIDKITKIIIDCNQTGNTGDGVIFISKTWESVQIRTQVHNE